jgi:anti-sigma factor RsiW
MRTKVFISTILTILKSAGRAHALFAYERNSDDGQDASVIRQRESQDTIATRNHVKSREPLRMAPLISSCQYAAGHSSRGFVTEQPATHRYWPEAVLAPLIVWSCKRRDALVSWADMAKSDRRCGLNKAC